MNIITLIAQIIGIAAMILTVLSLQCRSNRNFFLCQEIAGILFGVSFFMLGAWGGALMNLYGIIRPEVLRREKIARSKWVLAGLLLLLFLCSFVIFLISEEKWYLLLLVTAAQAAGTVCMWIRSGKAIRLCQLFVVSPFWMTYNILIPVPSVGGILTESINIISILIALIRYRKIGFTER